MKPILISIALFFGLGFSASAGYYDYFYVRGVSSEVSSITYRAYYTITLAAGVFYNTGECEMIDGEWRGAAFNAYTYPTLIACDLTFHYADGTSEFKPGASPDAQNNILTPPLPPEKSDPHEKEANTQEPINFISGNNHFSNPGISLPTTGIPLEFNCYYNSTQTNASPLGTGWSHSFNWSLETVSNTISLITGRAQIFTFSTNGGGTYSCYDNNWRLNQQPDGEYLLTLPRGAEYRFNTNGVLQEISDGWSNSISMVYSNGLLASASHINGSALSFSYTNGLVREVTAATNLALSFTYGTNDLLTQAVHQVDSKTFSENYEYSTALLLTQKVDAVNSDYHYSYSTNSKATGMYLTNARWYEHTVSYSTNGNNSKVTYQNGNQALLHSYDINPYSGRILESHFNAADENVTFAYDSEGNTELKTVHNTDNGQWTQIYRLYDQWHNVTNAAFGLSAEPTNFTHYTWHTNWQAVTSVTDPEDFKTEYEYTNGIIALSRIYLSSNEMAETTYHYETNGLLKAVTNANGHSTAFTYDDLGYPESVIPQVGPTITFGYDALGHLTNSTLPGGTVSELGGEPEGRTTAYTVTPLGWVERIDYPDTNYESFQYDGLGNLTNHVDRLGRTTKSTYAPAGHLAAVTRQFGSTNVTVSYDFDQQFNTLSIRDELNRPVESYVLDPLDRPTTVTNVENQTMSINYLVGDFVSSITRFDNTVVSNEYTGDGLIKAVHYPDQTNSYTYLKNGLLQTSEDSSSLISNSWNSASWLTQQVASVSAMTSTVAYAYDPVGNVTNTAVSLNNLSADSLTTSYSYDEAERLSTISTALTSSTNSIFSYTHNINNGLVRSVSTANISASYQYDVMDRIRSIDWINTNGASILSFDYQYNAVGMITNVVKNDGSQSSVKRYQYDDLDRLRSESTLCASVTSVVNYSYDDVGNRQTKTSGATTVTYDLGTGNRQIGWSATSTNSFADLRTIHVSGSSSEPIGTDDRWGQLWVSNSVAVKPTVSSTNFWADILPGGSGTQQVVAAIRDEAGNMGYATNEFFITVVTNGAYQYNEAGCVTNIAYTGAEYAKNVLLLWNSQYQLTNATVLTDSTTSTVSYAYDVLGRRTSRTVTGSGDPGSTNTEIYVYDGNQVVADLDENGNLLRSYVWGSGIDNLLALTTYGTETNTYFTLKDHLNSVHALVNEAGQIVERYEYDAWGRIMVFDSAGNELDESSIGNRYCFQGREIDWATGLYYFRARWYNPISGRWLSKDPIGISGGLNQYVFCGNNPINLIDPLGWCGDTPDIPGFPKDQYDILPANNGYDQYWVTSKNFWDNFFNGGDLVDADGNSVLAYGMGPAVGPGGRLTGYTRHGINQAISRNGRGVNPRAILDAVRNPRSIIQQAGGKIKYVGKKATVIVNKMGKVITTWGKPR